MLNTAHECNTSVKKTRRPAELLQQSLIYSVKTLGLSAIGTAALVGAHHLGRKQYNPQARLLDYGEGLLQTLNKARGSLTTYHSGPTGHLVEWITGVADLKTNQFAVVGIDNQRQICWQTAMPERVHDILLRPKPVDEANDNDELNLKAKHTTTASAQVAVMGRRPSERFWVLDADNGQLLYSIKADSDRHFYGHACYSLEGDLLYVTENNTADFSGIIGIYEVRSGYKKIGELATHGIGPHEIVMHPNGETLIIANGGIKTERASREELNIDSMQPSLVYIDRCSGKIIQQIFPEHNQMSVRHLAMHENGTVIIGIQFQGERHLNVPMVLTHSLGESAFTPLKIPHSNGWLQFHHYIASVRVNSAHNLVCVTTPIGGGAAIFDLNTGDLVEWIELADCAGVAVLADPSLAAFLVSDGQGTLTKITVSRLGSSFSVKVDKVQQPYAFDNHLNVIENR